MTGIVLAGGKSTRMGMNKGLVRIAGQTVLERVVDRVSQVADKVIAVIAGDDWVTPQLGSGRVEVVSDICTGFGSLGGIYTGLVTASSYHSLIVACDMPFLSVPLLRYLVETAPDYDIVVPRWQDKLEPLHAVYSRRCLQPLERMMQCGRLRIIDFFDEVRVRYITEAEISQFDPRLVSFFNINTPEDLVTAGKIAEELGE